MLCFLVGNAGPPGLSKFCGAFGHYAGLFQLDVVETRSSSKPIIQEPVVTITAVTIQPTAADTAAADVAAAAATAEEPVLKKPRTTAAAAAVLDDLYESTEPPPAAAAASNGQQQQQSGGQRAAAPRNAQHLGHGMSSAAPAVVCYICQLASIPGKLDPRKAAQLGVPKGPVSRVESGFDLKPLINCHIEVYFGLRQLGQQPLVSVEGYKL